MIYISLHNKNVLCGCHFELGEVQSIMRKRKIKLTKTNRQMEIQKNNNKNKQIQS